MLSEWRDGRVRPSTSWTSQGRAFPAPSSSITSSRCTLRLSAIPFSLLVSATHLRPLSLAPRRTLPRTASPPARVPGVFLLACFPGQNQLYLYTDADVEMKVALLLGCEQVNGMEGKTTGGRDAIKWAWVCPLRVFEPLLESFDFVCCIDHF